MILQVCHQSCIGTLTKLCVQPCRFFNANRAVVTKVKRDVLTRTYETTLVLSNGSSIDIRYKEPREIIKLPFDLDQCSADDVKRIKLMRRPRSKAKKTEEITTTFDPMKYLKK